MDHLKWKAASQKAAFEDPHDVAAELIETHDDLVKEVQNGLAAIKKAFGRAESDLKGLKRVGVGNTEAPTLLEKPFREVLSLQEYVNQAAETIGKTIADAKR